MNRLMLLVNFLCLASTGIATGEPEKIDIQSIQYRVFNVRAENLEPAETETLLKRLEAAYESEYNGKTVHLKDRVRKLVDACKISIDRCNHRHFDELDKLFSRLSSYHSNVILYLWHCKKEQFKICVERAAPRMKDAVGHLTKLELRSMKNLRQVVDNSHDGDGELAKLYTYVPYANIDDAVANYMKLKSGLIVAEAINKSDDGLELYRQETEKTLMDACGPVKRELDPIVSSLYVPPIEQRGELYKAIDKFTSRWLENYQICSTILNQMDILIGESFTRLNPKNLDYDDWSTD